MDQTALHWWLPVNVSTQGGGIDHLITVIHWFMGVLFVGWGLFYLYCLVRYRRREGRKALYHSVASTKRKEIALTVALTVVLIGFELTMEFAYSAPIIEHVRDIPSEKEATVVRVVAEQFSWNFQYPGKDGVFGKTDPALIAGDNPLGLDRNDPAAKDDIVTTNSLHFPIDKPVVARLSSKDVIHSFNVPLMRVKQDVIPGSVIPLWFKATQLGEYEIACAQLCGLGHYRMRGSVSADTSEQFAAWMKEREEELAQDQADAQPAAAQGEQAPAQPAEGQGAVPAKQGN